MWCMDLDTWCAASQAWRGNIGDDRGSRLAFGETGILHGLWLGTSFVATRQNLCGATCVIPMQSTRIDDLITAHIQSIG